VKKIKFTEEQIAYALKQAELDTPVAEVCRKMGSATRRFTTGGRSTVGCRLRSCAGCSLGKKLLRN
jgi:putative transposase